MIDSLNPYPKMKDSGVPWLGQVPDHWTVKRMKTLLRERVEKGHPDEPLLAATQTKGVVRKENYEHRTVLALKDLHLLKLVCVGDFVISLRSFQGGIEYARERGIISPAYTILYPSQRDMHGFLAKLFKSAPFIDALSLYVTGIRQGQNIDYEKLGRSGLPVPPLPEVAAIARFLEHVDRRMRRSIRAKQKLIKLLEERKQAIAHRLVTRGVDPNVRLKPSGFEWLGEVPEQWAVERGKCFFREVDERTSTGAEELLSVSHLTGVTPRNQKQITMFKAESYVGSKLCQPGDIAVNTMWAWMGPVGVSRFHGIVSPSYHTYRQRHPCHYNEEYLDLLLRTATYKTMYRVLSTGITSSRMRLYPEKFLCIPFLCPPVREQALIVDAVTEATRDADRVLTTTAQEVLLLRELRDRLITDVVTGKVDVREAAARLPAESTDVVEDWDVGEDVLDDDFDDDAQENLVED